MNNNYTRDIPFPDPPPRRQIKKEEAKITYFINKQLKNLISNIVDDRSKEIVNEFPLLRVLLSAVETSNDITIRK